MASTNRTPNYNLPQFIGTDKPTWLGDVNGAMSNIDSAIKENADGIVTLTTEVDTASSSIERIDTSINTINGTLESQATTIAQHNTAIADIVKDIDNLEPLNSGADGQYLMKTQLGPSWSDVQSNKVTYDNTTSLLSSSNVQGAIDEINTDVQSLETTVLSETKILCGVKKTLPSVTIAGNGASDLITIDFSADLPANAILVGCTLQTTPQRAFTDGGINIVENSINLYFINLYSRSYTLNGATFNLFYNISR